MTNNQEDAAIEALGTAQAKMHNAACHVRDLGMLDKEKELRGAADMIGQWICSIWDAAQEREEKN